MSGEEEQYLGSGEEAEEPAEPPPQPQPHTTWDPTKQKWAQQDTGPGGWRPGEDPRGPEGWRPGDPVAPRRGEEGAGPAAQGGAPLSPGAKEAAEEMDQILAPKASKEVTGFVHSRGFKKTPFKKVEWNERLKDHDLGPVYGLDTRERRAAVAGRRAKRLPLDPSERQRGRRANEDDGGSTSGGGSHASPRDLGAPVDGLSLLDPTIPLTMPRLSAEENAQLRARVLEKVEAQIAEIQKRLLKRRDKMDQLGFLSQDNNHARVEAMLKLEIRKRVRVEEIKEVVLSEMWQERAKAEPQEGLFANLEAKLINILDAVGSVETVQKEASRSSKGVSAQPSNTSSIGKQEPSTTSKKRESVGAAVAKEGGEADGGPAPKPPAVPRREVPQRVLEGATEEELLMALRQKRGAAAGAKQAQTMVPPAADTVQGPWKTPQNAPWKELPEWTARTQRLRQSGSDAGSSRGAETPRSESEGTEYDDEYEAVPLVQMGVPHMYGVSAPNPPYCAVAPRSISPAQPVKS